MNFPALGEFAPDFTLVDQNQQPHTLSDYRGKKVVVYFYPKAMTPGCTNQACDLRDHHARFVESGYVIFGVSADEPAKLKRFEEKYDLPFTLLSNTDLSVLKAYGVWGEKKFMGKVYDGIHRVTFVIDQDGKIEQIIDKVKTKEHSVQLLGA